MSKKKILLIDDNKEFLDDLQLFLSPNYDCQVAFSIRDGLNAVNTNKYNAVVLDIHFGGGKTGVDLLIEIRKNDLITPVIMVTRHDDIDTVVSAMREGANDYLNKPLKFKEFLIRLEKVLAEANLKEENLTLKEQLRKKQIPFFGSSSQISKVKDTIQKVAKLDSPILITGETGVGKEIAAREIHRKSNRKDKPFYIVNCSAIPENLIESELFGHEKGAFTGAFKSQIGKFEQANGSTLLIDEIGDLNPAIQAKLLNVLESQEFYKLGGNKLINTDIRFLFATNKKLKLAVKDKSFREDLYYRINVVSIEIPPLCTRPEDLDEIVKFYLQVFSQLGGKENITVSREALNHLKSYSWPGNIRELKNVIERACIMSSFDILEVDDFQFTGIENTKKQENINILEDYNTAKNNALQSFQKSYISAILERTNGSITEAAKQMGINRTSLQRMIKELNIK